MTHDESFVESLIFLGFQLTFSEFKILKPEAMRLHVDQCLWSNVGMPCINCLQSDDSFQRIKCWGLFEKAAIGVVSSCLPFGLGCLLSVVHHFCTRHTEPSDSFFRTKKRHERHKILDDAGKGRGSQE